jgi:hypothetical protein
MSIHTSGFVCEWRPSTTWDDITAYVLSVEGDFKTTGNGNGIAFGDSSDAGAKITIDPNASGSPLSAATWAYVPIRVTFTVDANTARGVSGVIIDFDQDADTVSFSVTGWKQLISTTRVYSPLFQNRPVATKTTASSIDDPTDGSYAAGLLNWIMWQAGGRPYEQAASYTTATFYYSLAQAPIAPKYSWVAGEDAWAEALRLVRACGGQLYQRPDGVIAYVSPLSIAGGASQFTLTQDDYQEITRQGNAEDLVTSFACQYVPRVEAGMQQIIDDSTQRVVAAGKSETIELEPQYPIASLETATGGTQLLATAISATVFDGTQVAQGSGYTHTLSVAAQKITIVVTNAGALPFVIERITLRGTPIVPTEAGTVTIGSGTPTQTIEQNPYIQSRSHAQRLARMALAFYGTPRPIIHAKGVLYDPAHHQVGMAGTLTQSDWGLASAPVALLGMQHSETGVAADLDLVVTTGLPALADYFLVQTASQISTKKIGY